MQQSLVMFIVLLFSLHVDDDDGESHVALATLLPNFYSNRYMKIVTLRKRSNLLKVALNAWKVHSTNEVTKLSKSPMTRTLFGVAKSSSGHSDLFC